MRSINEVQDEIIENFSLFDGDMESTLFYLMDLGKKLPAMDESLKTEDNIVKGCQSKVWLNGRVEDGKVYFDMPFLGQGTIFPKTGISLDPAKVEAAITPKTKAIVAVHIYGNLCDMDALLAIGKKHGLPVIEDSAEAIGSEYKGNRAGSMGTFGAFSFHGTNCRLGCKPQHWISIKNFAGACTPTYE